MVDLDRIYKMSRILGNEMLTVGPFDWCDFQTDGSDDAAQVNEAWNRLGPTGVLVGFGDLYITPGSPINLFGERFRGGITGGENQANWNYLPIGKTFRGPPGNTLGLRIHLAGSSSGRLIVLDGNNIGIEGMLLDGNRVNKQTLKTTAQSSSRGIEIRNGYGSLLKDLYIYNCGGAGIYKEDTNNLSHVLGYRPWQDIVINRCARGLHFIEGGDLLLQGLSVANPLYETIRFEADAGFNTIHNFHCWEGGNATGDESERISIFEANNSNIYLGGWGHNQLIGGIIDQWNWYGVFIWDSDGEGGTPWTYGQRNIILGCTFYGQYRASTSSYAIWVGSDNNVICNNVVFDSQSNITYAVRLANETVGGHLATGDYNAVVGNAFENGTVSDAGTGNQDSHNATL